MVTASSWIFRQRYARLNYIQQLDPMADTDEICRLIAGYEFPWDMTRALEVALLRTFCIPAIGKLLDQTGEFHHHPQKRYDDTGLIVSMILKWGSNSEKGRAAIERMNQIHGHFPISNDDFCYVLSTFIYEPIRWIERFGWRRLCDVEKQALYQFWRGIGEQMEIEDIPASYSAFEQFNRLYEQQHFCPSPATTNVGSSTVELFLGWFPRLLRPMIKPLVYAMMDEAMIAAFGFPEPSPAQRYRVERMLRWRGNVLCYFPPRHRGDFYVQHPQRSYPEGYRLEDLGPPALLANLNEEGDRSRPQSLPGDLI